MIEAHVVATDPQYDANRSAPATLSTDGRLRVQAVVADTTGNADYPTSASRLASSAATTNPTVVKASSGRIFRITGFNANAAVRYLKLYNKATAPTVGTDAPVWTEYLAPQSKFSIDMSGFRQSSGIGYALTVNPADNDATAVGTGDIMALNVSYS